MANKNGQKRTFKRSKKGGHVRGKGGRGKSKRRDSKKKLSVDQRVNANFEKYYTTQPGLLGPHEAKSFLSTLQRPLPWPTFRVNPVNLLKHDVLSRLSNEFMYELGDVVVDGSFLPPLAHSHGSQKMARGNLDAR